MNLVSINLPDGRQLTTDDWRDNPTGSAIYLERTPFVFPRQKNPRRWRAILRASYDLRTANRMIRLNRENRRHLRGFFT